MSLRWRFETQVPYGRFVAVVTEDGDGFSAEIEGEVLVSPQTGVFRIRDRIITDQHYGPESVRALSLKALRRTVEENIENHIGPVDPG